MSTFPEDYIPAKKIPVIGSENDNNLNHCAAGG